MAINLINPPVSFLSSGAARIQRPLRKICRMLIFPINKLLRDAAATKRIFAVVIQNYPDLAQLDFGSVSRIQQAEGDIQDYCKLYLRGSTCEAFSTHEQEEQAKCRMQNQGYTDRFMFLVVSHEGKTNAPGAGDETFRFWNALVQRTRQGSIGVSIFSIKTFPPSISELGSHSGSEVLSQGF
ncbi:unnamed protein product [Brassica oleracea var. botrytis]